MEYTLNTYQGLAFKLNPDFSLKDYVATINAPEVQAVNIGKISTLKGNIQSIRPKYAEGEEPVGEEVTIYTRDGKSFPAYVENYNPDDITVQVNAQRNSFIVIGDTGIHRNEYSMVMKSE